MMKIKVDNKKKDWVDFYVGRRGVAFSLGEKGIKLS
jgi:hypothetical protein